MFSRISNFKFLSIFVILYNKPGKKTQKIYEMLLNKLVFSLLPWISEYSSKASYKMLHAKNLSLTPFTWKKNTP